MTLSDKILGTWVFLMAVVLILLVFADFVQRIIRVFSKLGSREPDSVHLTLNQMYGDVHTTPSPDREYFNVAATEALRKHHNGT